MNDELKTYLEGMEKRLTTQMVTKADVLALESRIDEKLVDLGQSIHAVATHIDERIDELTPILAKVENHDTRVKYLEDRLPKLA
jgi:DNA repair ATPase RecN